MAKQNEREILKDILHGIRDLIRQTRTNRQELQKLEAEIVQLHDAGHMSDLFYDIEMERARRAHKSVNYCMKSLERQKKVALWQLKELE
ncbi:MAG TPA: hypothetical protein VK674_03995 [Candidatus Limnocylindria bacterium]|nr:hypothetical protein [Candidatus Limnocylindria bacterium]